MHFGGKILAFIKLFHNFSQRKKYLNETSEKDTLIHMTNPCTSMDRRENTPIRRSRMFHSPNMEESW